ncbi:MAG TPA: AraC family transcriptional regulator [Pyrinomonadaceae bacterium]|jgi:AraC family transcriptional regulator
MKESHTHCGYHGEISSSRVVRELSLAEAAYAPGLRLPGHSHRHAGFCLVLRGGYTEAYGRTLLECGPASVKFQPAGEVHTDLYGPESVRSFIVELNSEWLARVGAGGLVGDSPAVFRDRPTAWLMMRLRAEFHAADEESPAAIEGLALELIAETSRRRRAAAKGGPPRWLRQARELLDEGFGGPLSLSAVAAAVGVHPVHLAHTFRRHYRCSVGEYLRRRRVEFACRRIASSKDPLADVALAAGFSSQSHLSRVFKRVTGMTPAEYRAGSGAA